MAKAKTKVTFIALWRHFNAGDTLEVNEELLAALVDKGVVKAPKPVKAKPGPKPKKK